MRDPRGPPRIITEVEYPDDGSVFIMLDCGHTPSKNPHFQYKVGARTHCFACGQEKKRRDDGDRTNEEEIIDPIKLT